MPTSYTSLWRLAVIAPLDPATANSWGSLQDSTMPLMEQGAVGITAVNIAGLTTYSLTTANNSTDQARYLVQQYTGALANNCTVTIPNLQRVGWAQNSTTGAHNVILSAGGTTATILPDGQWYMYSCDGATNVSLVPVGFGSVRASQFVPTGSAVPTVGMYSPAANTLALATNSAIRLQIDPSGNLLYNTSSGNPIAAGVVGISITTGTNNVIINSSNLPLAVGFLGAGTLVQWYAGPASLIGSISTDGFSTSYNTTSDGRLKVKIGAIEYLEAADVIDRIVALWYSWKSEGDKEPHPGFFAQQVHKVCPWAVTKGRGRPGSKNFVPWQMDASQLMPFVIAYIQGLGKRVDALERRR